MKKIIVFKREEIEKEELDWQEDFKDLVCKKLGVKKFKELFSSWDTKNKYYVVVARV
jgi:hypothetical protein